MMSSSSRTNVVAKQALRRASAANNQSNATAAATASRRSHSTVSRLNRRGLTGAAAISTAIRCVLTRCMALQHRLRGVFYPCFHLSNGCLCI